MKANAKAYIGVVSAMLIFGTIGVFRRYIPLSSGLLAFTRGIIGAGFIYLYMKISGRRRIFEGISKKDLLLPVISGAVMGANWILLFEAYNHTTVATATLCYYMEPTIVILLSPLLLSEKLTVKKTLLAFVGVVGMVFVSGVFEEGSAGKADLIGILLGLCAAVLYSGVVLMNKKITVEDPFIRTFVQLLSAGLVMIPYLMFTEDFGKVSLDIRAALLLVAVGIIHTGLAYLLYFGSIGRLKAQSVALLSYIDPVFALILSALVLKEHLSFFGAVGAVLIIGSAILGERE